MNTRATHYIRRHYQARVSRQLLMQAEKLAFRLSEITQWKINHNAQRLGRLQPDDKAVADRLLRVFKQAGARVIRRAHQYQAFMQYKMRFWP